MAIAEHEPSKLYARNRGVLSMSKQQLSDFASKKKVKPQATGHTYDFRKQKGKRAPARLTSTR